MSRRKPGLTYEEHIDYGKRLKSIRKELMNLTTPLLSKKYPKNSKTATRARNAMKYLDQLRHELDSNLGEEHPDEPDNRVYLGPDE